MAESEKPYEKCTLPISLTDYKALTGRSVQDCDLELLVSASSESGYGVQEVAIKNALENMYRTMNNKGIEMAICLDVKISLHKDNYYYMAAFALGLKHSVGGSQNE